MATSEFLVQVLKGERKALLKTDVTKVNVPTNKYTSKETLAKVIKQHDLLRLHFPDDPVTQCDRQFVLDVINSLDPHFFGSVMHEYDVF